MSEYRIFECAEWADLPAALSLLCRDIEERVIPAQLDSTKPYTHICIEILEDSGRVVAYPTATRAERIDVAGTQVQCMAICDDIFELDNSSIGDAAHDREVGKIVHSMGIAVHSILSTNAKFPFFVYDQDGNAI